MVLFSGLRSAWRSLVPCSQLCNASANTAVALGDLPKAVSAKEQRGGVTLSSDSELDQSPVCLQTRLVLSAEVSCPRWQVRDSY